MKCTGISLNISKARYIIAVMRNVYKAKTYLNKTRCITLEMKIFK